MHSLDALDALEGGGGLGVLLAVAGAGAKDVFADVNGDGEGLVVVGAVLFQGAVGRGLGEIFLGELLEVGFGVAPRVGLDDFVNLDEDVLFDESFGGVVALVEVDGANDGLETVGHDDGVGAFGAHFFAVGEADEWLVAELVAGIADGLGADKCGAPSGHDAFGLVVVAVEEVAGDEFQNGVAEVFEAFVVESVVFFVFVDIAPVGQRGDEEVDVMKFEAKFFPGEVLIRFGVQFSILLNGFFSLLLT